MIETGKALGRDFSLDDLKARFDAVFLGMGLAGVNALRAPGRGSCNRCRRFHRGLRRPRTGPMCRWPRRGGDRRRDDGGGRRRPVEAAGSVNVTIVYRRGREKMSLGLRAGTCGDGRRENRTNAIRWPCTRARSEFAYTVETPEGLKPAGETFRLKADQVFKAIGQTLQGVPGGIALDGGKIAVTGPGRTSVAGVWAGGDCAMGGEDLTVTAVAEGRDAAEDIHAHLTGRA